MTALGQTVYDETIAFNQRNLLARLAVAFGDSAVGWRPLVAVLAAATMTLGNLAALWQDDVRRLLGWLAVSMTGYGLMGVVAVGHSDLAVPSILYFVLASVVGNLAPFGVVVELRGRTDIASYAGLARGHPLLATALVLAFLSFVGIPPLAGFVAKLQLFLATIDAGYTWLAVLAVANTVVSLFYYLRVLGPSYFDDTPRIALPVRGRWAAAATLTSAAAWSSSASARSRCSTPSQRRVTPPVTRFTTGPVVPLRSVHGCG